MVDIRSTGGDVNDALLIHDALCSLDAHITTRCYGYTASAATIIAQAASPGCREISANAPLPDPHGHLCRRRQRRRDSGKTRPAQTDTRIAAVYAARSGRPAREFEALMAENNGNGRWLSPEEAVAAGLADTVTDNGSARHPRWQGISPAAGSGCSQASGSTAARASRRPQCTAHRGERQELLRRSATAIRQAQQNASPTCTKPREDPSYGDTVRTANQRAYAEDVKRFKGI